jgi:hypothetical protein
MAELHTTYQTQIQQDRRTEIVRGILYDLIPIFMDYSMKLSETKLYNVEWYDNI